MDHQLEPDIYAYENACRSHRDYNGERVVLYGSLQVSVVCQQDRFCDDKQFLRDLLTQAKAQLSDSVASCSL